MYKIHNDLSRLYARRIFTNSSNVHTQSLEILSYIIMTQDSELSLKEGTYTAENLFYETKFPQRLETCLA